MAVVGHPFLLTVNLQLAPFYDLAARLSVTRSGSFPEESATVSHARTSSLISRPPSALVGLGTF